MNKKELSKDSTVYHYRLLKRIHYNTPLILLYWGIVVGVFIWDLFKLDPYSLIVALIVIPLLHTLLIYLHVTLKEKRPLTQWQFEFKIPWLGYAPTHHIPLKKFKNLHFRVLWMTIVIIGCFYPWVAHDILFNFLFVHLWIYMPRLMIFLRFRKHTRLALIKLNEKDTSCYVQ